MADLNATTLPRPIGATERFVHLTSTSGIAKGDLLVADREAMLVVDVSVNPVRVLRGAAGTAATSHADTTVVYSGTPDKFHSVDPVGIPAAFPLTNPWINLRDGRVFVAQGDEVGAGTGARFWQLQTLVSPAAGVFGTRLAPTITP